MGEFLSPNITGDEVTASQQAARGGFTNNPVEAGEYEMVIKTTPKVQTARSGRKQLTLMLTHTGDFAKGTTAVYPTINAPVEGDGEKTIRIARDQFIRLLLALGYSTEQIASSNTGWRALEGAVEDDKGRVAAEIVVDGEAVSLEGRLLSVYLTSKERTDRDGNPTGGFRNEVGRFIAA